MPRKILTSIHCKIFLALLLFYFVLPATAACCQTQSYPRGAHSVSIPHVKGVQSSTLKSIAPIVEKSIAKGSYPGAVVLASYRGHIIYKGVFGNQSIIPKVAPMRFDTIFDVASLTKVVATAPAVMQLVEQKKLDLDAPVAKYWPAFAQNGKGQVTIRELLTHTSGLPPDLPPSPNLPKGFDSMYTWHGEQAALNQVQAMPLKHPPGTTFAYSDVNFIVLGYLVELTTGQRFDHYAQNHIFNPLGMKNTAFLPPTSWQKRIAPTQILDYQLRWGVVHDPTAHAMGGVSGEAGLFSNAKDLGVYAQCLLNDGRLPRSYKHGKQHMDYLLRPKTVSKMTSVQTPSNMADKRGLGWDISSRYAGHGMLFPVGSYGHTGWTGTSVWIDPDTQTWIIILTSRTHPKPARFNQIVLDRRAIADIVLASVHNVPISPQQIMAQITPGFH